MGSLVKCRACGIRCGERPIGVYWRWMRADGVWKKYYARVCIGCYTARVIPLDVVFDPNNDLTCPQCGIVTEHDYDAIYVTAFPGKNGQVNIDAPFCGPHAAMYRSWVISFAEDRELLEGAPEPLRESGTAGGSPAPVEARVA